jgi:Uma2 family endonuclease
MATTTNLLSWQAFEQLPDDGTHHEILEGELQTLPPPKSGHSIVAKRVWRGLLALEDKGLAEALSEAGYKLSQDPATWIQPDVSLLRKERAQHTPHDGYFLGAPELAVEVVSPSESAKDLRRKVSLLLAHGSGTVWVIYPEALTVDVFFPNGTSRTYTQAETLTLPDWSSDWKLPIAKLFED